MNNMIFIEPISTEAASITLTNDYLVLKGKHYHLLDWYIKKTSGDVVIPTRDILSIEFINMRSKRAFMLFIVLATVFLTYGNKMKMINEGLYVLLLSLCVSAILYHVFCVFRFCRVTARGNMIAVKTKHYQRNQLEYLISHWNNMRSEI